MRLPRLTLKRAMLLVALVAVTLGVGGECIRRRSRFLSLASSHAAEACDGRIVPLALRTQMTEAELAAYGERRLAWEEYHNGLVAKYERAARYPWLPVAPDPREPR